MITSRRITTARHKTELKALQLLCLPKDDPIQHGKNGCAFAVFDGDRMVAFALANRSRGYQQTMYLSRAGVHPDYRGRGLQKELIRLREAWARRNGIHYAVTDTTTSSVQSMRSLIAMGYKPYWPVLVKPWALRNSVYWRKSL